jgi:hypothetical protein
MESDQEFPALSLAIKSDVIRYSGRYGFWLLTALFFFDRTFRVVCTLRLCQAVSKAPGLLRGLILFPLSVFTTWLNNWRRLIYPGGRGLDRAFTSPTVGEQLSAQVLSSVEM